jgi:DNA-binding transcriptional ArsR family regulator
VPSKPLSNATDPNLVKALAHPLRVRMLGALERRIASPNELAIELDEPLGNVSYHMRQLASFGLVKLVRETPRRGAVEHYYELDVPPTVSDHTWSQAPAAVRNALIGSALSQIGSQVVAAADKGGFDRSESLLNGLPLTLDDQGFADAARELEVLTARLAEIESQSRHRLNGAVGGSALAVLLLADSP